MTPRTLFGRWDDDALERVVGRLLQGGVMLAAAVTGAGGILYLIQHGRAPIDARVFATGPVVPMAGYLPSSAGASQGETIVLIGLMILVATPVARVALLAIGFLLERDWLYTVVSFVVLVVLLGSLVFGR